MPEKSILDARLAEIDRRLQTIQSGLEPAVEAVKAERAQTVPLVVPEAAPAPKRLAEAAGQEFAPSPRDPEARQLVARLAALVEAHERLLSSARALVERAEPADAGAWVSVSAGPFDSTEALRRFERDLQTLPGVRSATVREYEGANRAVLDVHLFDPTP
jgi:hypothetical protein